MNIDVSQMLSRLICAQDFLRTGLSQRIFTVIICIMASANTFLGATENDSLSGHHAQMGSFGIYDVRSFGAKGDGTTLDTTAIQQAVDKASLDGGGVICFPAPGRYLTGTIFMKDNITLEIPVGATILGSNQFPDYDPNVGHSPYITEHIDYALIYANKARNIALTGRGTINGNTTKNVLLNSPAGQAQRPMLVRFEDCSGIRVDQLTFIDCFTWCFHFARCKDIHVDGLSIFNQRQDGIDLESCEDVTIDNCNIKSGDDAIAILANRNIPCRNIAITNCILSSYWAGVRLGPLSYGDIEQIAVSNCVIRDCHGGGIKIAMLEGGKIRHCLFSNLTMNTVVSPIVVMLVGNYEQTDNPKHPQMPLGQISHLTFSHIVGTAAGGLVKEPDAQSVIFLQGHPQQNLESITLSDISLTFSGGGTAEQASGRAMLDADHELVFKPGLWPEHRPWGISPAAALYARHVKGLSLDHIRFATAQPDLRSACLFRDSSDIILTALSFDRRSLQGGTCLTVTDCQDVLISECLDHGGGNAFVTVEGDKTSGLCLSGNSLRNYKNIVQRSAAIPDREIIVK